MINKKIRKIIIMNKFFERNEMKYDSILKYVIILFKIYERKEEDIRFVETEGICKLFTYIHNNATNDELIDIIQEAATCIAIEEMHVKLFNDGIIDEHMNSQQYLQYANTCKDIYNGERNFSTMIFYECIGSIIVRKTPNISRRELIQKKFLLGPVYMHNAKLATDELEYLYRNVKDIKGGKMPLYKNKNFMP